MTTQDPTPLRPAGSAGQAPFIPENPYAEEAEARWGKTDAWKQSQERVKKMSKEDFERIGKEGDAITREIAQAAEAGKDPTDSEVQALIARHYAWLRHWYEPTLEMYRGLGSMYVDDARFTATYDKHRPGLAIYIRDAMHAFCDAGTA
jgi:hypothetical protein